MPSYAIGVDLGGTNLRIAAVDESGRLLSKTALETQVSRGREHVIEELCQATKAMAQEMQDKHGGDAALCGIGIGVPGLVDIESGRLVESPNLPGWSNYDVKGEIEGRLGTPVILENDANAAALGEQWLGAGRNSESMCMITLGTGVGGGLVLNGKIWHGWNGMAGELGHCNVEPDGHPCNCGSHGCIEQYASATAIVRMAREALASGAATELRKLADDPSREFNSRVIYECAMRGDEVAKKVFERMGRSLGLVLGDMVNTLNLPIYVIGGGVSDAWEAFSPAMFEEVRRRSFLYAATTPADGNATQHRSTLITRALMGGDGGLYGAARLPLVHLATAGKAKGDNVEFPSEWAGKRSSDS